MPIKIPNDLPAFDTLTKENIFVMKETRAVKQDIRPLKILLLNLMPTKIDTETQFSRLLGNTPLQVELELLQTSTYHPKNISEAHLLAFYKNFDEIKDSKFDGMVITGAPVEQMEYEEVKYWDELCKIMEWSKTHVHSTFHVCWGAMAGLYYHYGIKKCMLDEKLFGVFPHKVERRSSILMRGFDDIFMIPHSRHTDIDQEAVRSHQRLRVLASSEKAGIFCIATEKCRQVFITGHPEYDPLTLQNEYLRDKNANLPISVPENYYPDNDDTKAPIVSWRSSANLLYSNWLNYIVYQNTPYKVEEIKPLKVRD